LTLSQRDVEYLQNERGIEISHETFRYWWTHFGPILAAEIPRMRVERMSQRRKWMWHLTRGVKWLFSGHDWANLASDVSPLGECQLCLISRSTRPGPKL